MGDGPILGNIQIVEVPALYEYEHSGSFFGECPTTSAVLLILVREAVRTLLWRKDLKMIGLSGRCMVHWFESS